jgi:hypothetical protein
MRGLGLLCIVCALLLGAGAISCRLEFDLAEEPAKLTRTTPEGGFDVDVRQAPLSKAPDPSDAAGSGQAGICDPGATPVVIVVVPSPKKVESASELWKATPIVVRDPETVVFADGRIVTSRLEATGDHLQSLGWTHRDIEIVGGLPAATGAWQRRSG